MAGRPDFIDLNLARNGAFSAMSNVSRFSPKVQYCDGDFPPALSPLDAFAAQSRRMAVELDMKRAGQRRMSRLPPALVNKSLSQHRSERPECFRSLSENTELSSEMKENDSSSTSLPISQSKGRPKSEYISVSPVSDVDESAEDGFTTSVDHPSIAILHPDVPFPTDYFGALRVESPASESSKSVSFQDQSPQRSSASEDSVYTDARASAAVSISSEPDLTRVLASPPAVAPSPAAHLRVQRDFSDDDYTSSIAGSTFSYPRKLSSSSGVSAPHSPILSYVSGHARSTSNTSERSTGFAPRSKSHLNFSHPLNGTSLRSSGVDSPSRQRSNIQDSCLTVDGDPHSRGPTSFDEARSEKSDAHLPKEKYSYTYTKFSLPRGRVFSRDSTMFSALGTPHFEWEEPLFQNTPAPSSPKAPAQGDATASLVQGMFDRNVIPQVESARGETSGFSFGFDRSKTPERVLEISSLSLPSSQSKFSTTFPDSSIFPSPGRAADEHGDIRTFCAPPIPKTETEDTRSTSSKSNSTIRPQSMGTATSSYQYTSPDEHVTKGIERHEAGSLKESTYHLRIAAMANHPTGMLLYALACRHGWGIRPNQREGLQWLRKAVDSAMLEVADVEDPSSGNSAKDVNKRRARRAQFALSIYELGISHLNGWGIEQDKALALRCFEIAGSWGDADALTEAGFCYAEGIGCKKDLKKAAKFYRLAESKGVSMVGNSWIHKDKYNESDDARGFDRGQSRAVTPGKKPQRSKSRIIFGRKKSFQPS